MAAFEEYANRYETIRIEHRYGIFQITFHTNEGSLKWGPAHREFGYPFTDISRDLENKVLIMTGTGDDFCPEVQPRPGSAGGRTPRDLGPCLLGREETTDEPPRHRGAHNRGSQRAGHNPC